MTNIILYIHIGDIPEANLQSQSESGRAQVQRFPDFHVFKSNEDRWNIYEYVLKAEVPDFPLHPRQLTWNPKIGGL